MWSHEMLSVKYVPPALKHGFKKGDIVMAPVSRCKIATFLVDEIPSCESMRIIAFNAETGELTSFSRVVHGDDLNRFSIDSVATKYRQMFLSSLEAQRAKQ
jgi:hypothetical protein